MPVEDQTGIESHHPEEVGEPKGATSAEERAAAKSAASDKKTAAAEPLDEEREVEGANSRRSASRRANPNR
ncbi:hypothetical protein D3C86_2159060 [compost metagenome]